VGDEVCLEVQDEGHGISPEKLSDIQSQGSGVGIRGMRERVRQFDGEMNIESTERGTNISFKLRLDSANSSMNESASEQSQAAG
jgi:signal transduction histidine kinase